MDGYGIISVVRTVNIKVLGLGGHINDPSDLAVIELAVD